MVPCLEWLRGNLTFRPGVCHQPCDCLPSGKHGWLENGPIEDVFPHWTWGFSIAMLVYWRVFGRIIVCILVLSRQSNSNLFIFRLGSLKTNLQYPLIYPGPLFSTEDFHFTCIRWHSETGSLHPKERNTNETHKMKPTINFCTPRKSYINPTNFTRFFSQEKTGGLFFRG